MTVAACNWVVVEGVGEVATSLPAPAKPRNAPVLDILNPVEGGLEFRDLFAVPGRLPAYSATQNQWEESGFPQARAPRHCRAATGNEALGRTTLR